MAVLLASVLVVGLLAGLPFYLLAYLRVRSGERWGTALAVSAACLLVLFGVLVLLLRLPATGGLAGTWFGQR